MARHLVNSTCMHLMQGELLTCANLIFLDGWYRGVKQKPGACDHHWFTTRQRQNSCPLCTYADIL
ncbi:hypothetical protein HBI56_229750 [Parastagonospora nodorum]|uniref:Uncharacterized protein n=1 Tax=Phaeosphaeria nodorum (strain SN15 / ATCC MYA-4574 / FGSC 10173) TaxID=321614 RepID=A0A7U2F8T7_PHANO|nr:hypothetical protein HBH56_201390 [Parastagonospora nodorum]QRD00854.1 hypothetical protein JI435_415890 [Parastagonospora nodorum SN15]KAH3925748.1 hypothetical protein HBH54_174900 [Parastagonospora nodorum]KAH3952852.1 hypothetical protein HBH53_036290 [Parastagonospora nodorum]KAH4000497.1 hypothetical protein HBI10_099210 [Parastagonospora nodorum]